MDQELVQYLDKRFHAIDMRFQTMEDRFEQRFEEVKRHTGILVEGLRHEVHLLAEGLATHIEAEHVRHQGIQEQFRETRALIHLSYERRRGKRRS